MSRWPTNKKLPNAEKLAVQSLVDSDGWPWLVEQVEGQITSLDAGLVQGSGASTWDEYQYLLGVRTGLTKLIDLVDSVVSLETEEHNERGNH